MRAENGCLETTSGYKSDIYLEKECLGYYKLVSERISSEKSW